MLYAGIQAYEELIKTIEDSHEWDLYLTHQLHDVLEHTRIMELLVHKLHAPDRLLLFSRAKQMTCHAEVARNTFIKENMKDQEMDKIRDKLAHHLNEAKKEDEEISQKLLRLL